MYDLVSLSEMFRTTDMFAPRKSAISMQSQRSKDTTDQYGTAGCVGMYAKCNQSTSHPGTWYPGHRPKEIDMHVNVHRAVLRRPEFLLARELIC